MHILHSSSWKFFQFSRNGHSGQKGQERFCWSLWIVRVVRIIMEVNSSLGNVVWCGVLQFGLVWYAKIARMNWFSYGTMSWLLWFQAFLKACQQAQNYNGEIGLRFFAFFLFCPVDKNGQTKILTDFWTPSVTFSRVCPKRKKVRMDLLDRHLIFMGVCRKNQ